MKPVTAAIAFWIGGQTKQAQLGQRYIARCQVDKIAHQGDERRLMLFPLCQRRRKTGAEQHAQI